MFEWERSTAFPSPFQWEVSDMSSRKLEASIKKIDRVFDKMRRKGLSVGERRASDRTIQTYTDMMKGFMRSAHKEFGVSDVSKITKEQVEELFQKRIDLYHDGDMSQAFNLKTLAASITSFNLGVQETNVFSYDNKFVVGDIQEIRELMREQQVVRKSKASTVLRATPLECESVLQNIKDSGYDTNTRDVAYNAAKISLETGGRISAILKLRPSDIKITTKNGKEIYQVEFYKDKGGLTRSVEIAKESAEYLMSLAHGKKPNQRIFETKRNDGTYKSVKELRKEVSKVIASAGEHLTRQEPVKVKDKDGKEKIVFVTKKASAHMFRKAFAMAETKKFLDMFASKSVRKRYVKARIKEDSRLKDKLDTLKDRINKHIPKDQRKEKGRKLTKEEYAIFFASVSLGHFRNEIIGSFYTTLNEVKGYYDKLK